jgi:deoxycytidine triphosphate deaminase
MFMLSKFMFDAAYANQKHLKIEPYEPKHHINNFYYFRFGGIKEEDKVVKTNEDVEIASHGFIQIWSLERFELSDRIFALFGNLSAMVSKGLDLIHSPSIDPGFSGSLALGLRNNLNVPVTLHPHEKIGKIIFFDCADTFVNVEQFVENVLKNKELEERRKAGEVMLRAYSELTEGKK